MVVFLSSFLVTSPLLQIEFRTMGYFIKISPVRSFLFSSPGLFVGVVGDFISHGGSALVASLPLRCHASKSTNLAEFAQDV